MKLYLSNSACQHGSVLIIVLWIALGLVTITLYFANSMNFELRASDNRTCALAADQAIEGAARYVTYVLTTLNTNGAVPDPTTYPREAVPVGDAHFWLIGRVNPLETRPTVKNQPNFGLVDEASKLNLNKASTNALEWLPRMTADFASAIIEWRDTNGGGSSSLSYSMLRPPYQCKSTNFESVDELRLVYGANMELLTGEDANRNGVLDVNENDENRNNEADPGVLEYVTVYSREPATFSNGVARINVNNRGPLTNLLQQTFGPQRATAMMRNFPPNRPMNFRSPLGFYLLARAEPGKMTADEFAQVASAIKINNSTAAIEGRVNINTASGVVLTGLLGGDEGAAQQLISYRQTNPDQLTSVAWVCDALTDNTAALQSLAAADSLTTQSFQFSADVAALGPFGRGFRRVKFILDTSSGTPQIIYRQDLSHLGWALGKPVRETWFLAKDK